MRAAVYYNNSDVRIEERPTPAIGPKELLVKIVASGICGSDVLEWYRVKKAPIVLGHEISGEIEAVGESITQYAKGDRVFVSHHIPCNTCHYCLNDNHTACETLHTTNFDPGGFCEYVRIPALNVDRGVFPLPDAVTHEQATFVEPLACVIRGQRVAQFKPGQSVLVLGSGISGLLHILLARAMGAGRIFATDVDEYRLEAARACGADRAIHASEDVAAIVTKENGRAIDKVVVCTGAYPAFTQALDSVDRGGTVLFFATTDPGVTLPIPVNDFWRNSITLLPSYGNSPYDATVALSLLASKRVVVDDLITHRLPLEKTQEGFSLVAQSGKSIKVIIRPHDEE